MKDIVGVSGCDYWEPDEYAGLGSITVFEDEEEFYDSGILDASGNPVIYCSVRNPIGFTVLRERE